MAQDWTELRGAAQVLALTLDPRPAWLWSGDGQTLLWRNVASFAATRPPRLPNDRFAPVPEPIRGQVPRLVKIGVTGRPSMSRMRFLANGRPLSLTCLCTPVGSGDEAVLLIMDSEAVQSGTQAGDRWRLALNENLFDPSRAYEIVAGDGAKLSSQGRTAGKRREFVLGNDGALMVLFDGAAEAARPGGGLTSLVDRLANAEGLYDPLDDEDEELAPINLPVPMAPAQALAPEGSDRYLFALGRDGGFFAGRRAAMPAEMSKAEGFTGIAPFALNADGKATAIPIFDRFGAPAGWRAYGELPERVPGPKRVASYQPAPTPAPPPAPAPEPQAEIWRLSAPEVPSVPESEDRQSRYNFAELTRILTDRINGPNEEAARTAQPRGDLVPLSDENLVLNRLPLGLLVFRDDAILFVNRAMADLTGYASSTALREAGLDALFPEGSGVGGASIGPVTRLVGQKGDLVPVVARLQTISWQGRQAYLLSARAADAAVPGQPDRMTTRATVELIAAQSDCGFIQLTRTGNIDGVSERGAAILGPSRTVLLGRPLLSYLDGPSKARLAGFLSQAGQSIDEAVTVRADAGAGLADLTIFADRRRDGRVEGFLGLVRAAPARPKSVAPALPAAELGAVISQLSRELRGPLNTILGFSSLMAGDSGARPDPARVEEYARDIWRAGRQIGMLVDELTDLGRLENGHVEIADSEIDLGALLEACVARIRPEANARQIVVRSAVSQSLPKIRADRNVLTQTVMNLLASAISLSGRGGNVVLSAKQDDKGGIDIHVRDHGGRRVPAPEEGFVVYRAPDPALSGDEPLRSGTGLALTKSLARANALSLSFDEEPGAGTLMSLEIPAAKVIHT